MEIQSGVDISKYTTFRMGPTARYFAVIKTAADLAEAHGFAKEQNLPIFILGSGSNVILGESGIFEAVVLKIELPGFEIIEDGEDSTTLKIGAGENWDDVVKHIVEMNLWGIEALSAIPGTAGATPIQNVGAYGKEIADVLISLEAYQIATGDIITLAKSQCKFNYRDSIFKHEAKDKYVITSITIKLSKKPGQMPDYPGVKNYFEDRKITKPTLAQIREAIINIRNVKLPDPKKIASVGSFFKNPIVTKEIYQNIKKQHSDVIAFPVEDGKFKIGAGWLLDSLGLKGEQFGNLQFYPNNALVLVNKGNATFAELKVLIKETQKKVKDAFEIDLETEPIIVQ